METVLKCAVLLVLGVSADTYDVQKKCFHSLSFGVSTAAYQIEGAWNVSGKSASIWDTYVHRYPGRVFDHTTGDVATDSYHYYKDDVRLLKDLRVQYYRFSIAWSRILPTGFSNSINQDGVRYYSSLIDELLAHDIQPLVTMYHWDLPQTLQDMGGWTNPITADYFADYARVLFTIFGSRVQAWLTFNEPLSFCHEGYGGLDAPGAQSSGLEEYMCTHNVLRAHGMVYRLYERKFKNLYNGLIGITLDLSWLEPNTTSAADQKAAEVARQFTFGWFAHPIFSAAGDYPPIMRIRIDSISLKQNYSRSRLPKFTDEEIEMIRGSAHFLGLNHYTTYLVSPNKDKPIGPKPSFGEDMGVIYSQKSEWPRSNSTWLKVVPWGLRKALNWVKHEYRNPMVIITENGVSMEAGLKDPRRVSYIDGYLRSLHDAIYKDSCAVFGYTYWSLMDNFEWLRGYSEKFGLYQVDFSSPNRTRTPRQSASYFADVAATGCLPDYNHYNIVD